MNENNFSSHLFLEERRKVYEQGEKSELLWCLVWCLQRGEPIPPWVHYEFVQAWIAVTNFEKSWNDVFGHPLPKSKTGKARVQQAVARRDIRIAYPIWAAVQKLHLIKEQPIEQAMFEKIAKMFDPEIKFSTIRAIYYRFEKGMAESFGFKNGIVPKEFARTLEVRVDTEYSKMGKAFLKSFQKD